MAKVYSPTRYARHVRAWWTEAGEAERSGGLTWYARAHAEAVLLAARCNVEIPVAVGVIAALSPQVRWERNVLLAERLLRGEAVSEVYGANIAKAQRILDGAVALEVLRGPKVLAFYALILSAGSTDEVCIDSIAILAATGVDPNPLVSNDDAAPVFGRPRQLAAIRAAYTRVALELGVKPNAVQAAVWLAWRNERDKE